MNDGFIKLFRKFKQWEWYSDVNTKVLFLHLLLSANHTDKSWRGITVKRGQIVVGLESLSIELGLSIQKIRTALKHLKSTNEIAIETTNKFSVITLVNWEKYQDYDTRLTNELTSEITNEEQSSNNQLTTNNNDNNVNNINKKKNIKKKKTTFIKPTIEEIKNYCNERKNNVVATKFYNFYESKDWFIGKNKMKDWKAAVRTWELNTSQKQNYIKPYKQEPIPEWMDIQKEKETIDETTKKELEEFIKEF